jgi:hypothetical protein
MTTCALSIAWWLQRKQAPSIWYAGAFPARTFQSPARGEGFPASVPASGSSTSASSGKSRRAGPSSKTSLPFALADWIPCSGASLRSGMMRSGIVYPLPPLALLTGEIGSGLWRTPNTRDGMQSGYSDMEALRRRWANGHQVQLVDQVRMWPTPTVDSASDRSGRYAQGGMPLAAAVKLWPTPHGMCAPGPRRPGPSGNELGRAVLAAEREMWPTPTSRDWKSSSMGRQGNARPLSEHLSGPLNPTWVELLMGFPPGWTEFPPGNAESPA